MKFKLPSSPEPIDITELRVGNVYRCKGGGKTVYWIVIACDFNSVQVIGLNREGTITSATSYGRHVFDPGASKFFRPRQPIGYCAGLEDLNFTIEWIEGMDGS